MGYPSLIFVLFLVIFKQIIQFYKNKYVKIYV